MHVNAHSPVPIRWQPAAAEACNRGRRRPARPGAAQHSGAAGFLSINPNTVARVLVAVLAGLVAQYAMKRPDPGIVVVTLVAAVGAASLIVAQRTIWPAVV